MTKVQNVEMCAAVLSQLGSKVERKRIIYRNLITFNKIQQKAVNLQSQHGVKYCSVVCVKFHTNMIQVFDQRVTLSYKKMK